MIQDHSTWTFLLKKHVKAGGLIDYEGFRNDRNLLVEYLQQLSNTNTNKLSVKQKLAFWINAYNAFTISLVLNNKGIASIKSIHSEAESPWKIPFIKIGTDHITLDHIEHNILRKEFNEPRIHFCLVCACKSCPELRPEAYEADFLDIQLEEQLTNFINNPSRNNLDGSTVELSGIFKGYKTDFADYFQNDETCIAWINKYSNIKVAALSQITYLPFDCALNGVDTLSE